MSKVTYLIGAGASYGERGDQNNYFLRGVPIISEFQKAINDFRTIYQIEINKLDKYYSELEKICEEYPTIDTYSKLLYVTSGTTRLAPSISYDDIKRLLSIFLLLHQCKVKRDQRYDGFIASVINEKKEFPPMTILSWNYDAQFELAYAGYSDYKYIREIWKSLNVYNKTYPLPYDESKGFAFIKLNGTAFFTSNKRNVERDSTSYQQIMDIFHGGNPDIWALANNLYDNISEYHNTLSYVWEKENRDELLNTSVNRTKDTETLIVIGYSFPYVNREIDDVVISNMTKLKKIIVQDKYPDDVIDRIKSIISNKEITIEAKKVNQFYIPSSFT